MGAWVILMSTPGPFPLKGEMFLTCVADLGGTSGPNLELNKNVIHCFDCYIRGKLSLKYIKAWLVVNLRM